MSVKASILAARYGRKTDIIEIVKEILEEQYHINAFTNPDCAIITHNVEIQNFQWGLIPYWTKDEKNAKTIRTKTYNARAETLFEKPSFREPIKYHRCIVPSTGYFEWHHNADKSKTPYFIFLEDMDIFSMGGIFDEWVNPETGNIINTFSIITTPANELTKQIHNGSANSERMPLILSKEDEQKWLNPDLSKDEIGKLLQTFPAEEMQAYPVYNDFLIKNQKDPSIINPI